MNMALLSHIPVPTRTGAGAGAGVAIRFNTAQRTAICNVITGHEGLFDPAFEAQIRMAKQKFENQTALDEPVFSDKIITFLEEAYDRDHEETWQEYKTKL